MLDEKALSILNCIVDSIRETGLNPYEQLYGYITTRNVLYITRHGNARNLIQDIKLDDLCQYLDFLMATDNCQM